ncbi:MAG: hypothetical protein V2A73_16070 [Pseudomonadota bacterium]
MAAEPVQEIQFFAGQSPTKIESLSRSIQFDAVVSRTHSFISTIADSPIEDGTSVTDHVIKSPRALTIEGLVSDHPVDKATRENAAVAAQKRSQTAAAILEELWSTAATLRVITRLRIYNDMVIERLEWQETQDSGQTLTFRMDLREIKKVSASIVDVEVIATVQADLAAGPTQRGKRALKKVREQKMIDSLSDAAKQSGNYEDHVALQSIAPEPQMSVAPWGY